MDRNPFRFMLQKEFHITDDIMQDRIFKEFDKDSDGKVSEEEWIRGMSVFLVGTQEEKRDFVFKAYAMKDPSLIRKDDIYQMLKTSLATYKGSDEDPEEGIKDLTDLCLKKLDIDGDNCVSREDYGKSVDEEGLLLEVLGRCLPKAEQCKKWLEDDDDDDDC